MKSIEMNIFFFCPEYVETRGRRITQSVLSFRLPGERFWTGYITSLQRGLGRLAVRCVNLVSHAFYHRPQLRPFWDYVGDLTPRIDPKHFVPIGHAYVFNNVSPPLLEVKRIVFFMLLVVAGMNVRCMH